MENSKELLALMAALTLVMSAFSANSLYYSAYADDEDGEETHDEGEIAVTFGESSRIELEVGDKINDNIVKGELDIEAEDGDIANGEHAVSFSCASLELKQTLGSLKVREGEGEFEGRLALTNGTSYEDCKISIGELAVTLPPFEVQVYEDEDDDSDENSTREKSRDDNDDKEKRSDERMHNERKIRVEVEDEDVAKFEIEVSTNLTDGTYNAVFTCDAPAVNKTLANAFEVEDGEGEFDMRIALENGTYTGCELTVEGTVIATFDSFTVDDREEGDDGDAEEKRKERRHEIVSNAGKRRMNANPASPGDYSPRLNYMLNANGTADFRMHEDEESDISDLAGSKDVELDINMTAWKSNRALILMNVLDGTIEVGNQTYNVRIGYALYSLHHDAMRINAFVTDEDGNVMKLKLRGSADNRDAEFPMEDGESIRMNFEGKSGGYHNRLGNDLDMMLKGTIQAT